MSYAALEAFEQGYRAGLCLAQKVLWPESLFGRDERISPLPPADAPFSAAYRAGFADGLHDGSEVIEHIRQKSARTNAML